MIQVLSLAPVYAADEVILSMGKAMSASSGTATAGLANDLNGDTFWDGIISDQIIDDTGTTPSAWLQMDLGLNCSLTRVIVKPYYLDGRYYNYYVNISSDGINWTKIGENVGTEPETEAGNIFTVSDQSARYVRVSVYKNSVEGNYSAHIRELEVYGLTPSDAELLAADKENLHINFGQNNSAENVVKSFSLPMTGAFGSAISWESSMPECINIINGDAIVVRPQDGDKQVTLTAVLTKGTQTDTKLFTLTVKKAVQGEDLAELISQGKPATASYSSYPVTNGPDKVNDGRYDTYWDGIRGDAGLAWIRIDLMSTFTIKSINVAPYFDGIRYYNYFIETSEDGETWTKAGEKTDTTLSPQLGDTYDFTDKILARYVRVSMTKNSVDNFSVHLSEIKVFGYKDDIDAVAEDKESLNIGYAANENSLGVTKNISLPITGNCGTTITWFSSAPDIIDNDGRVTRPYDADETVTLMATISKGSASDTKSFNVNVKHLVPLSIGAAVTASSVEPGSSAAYAVDNNDDTYWAGYIDGTTHVASLTVDLLNPYDLTTINIRPFSDGSRYYNYNFEESLDGVNWTTLGTNNSTTPTTLKGEYYDISSKARYIRLNVTHGPGFMAHIKEIKIYGSKTDDLSVSEDIDSLNLQYAQGDSAQKVRMNITLPSEGSNGTNITWQSSNPAIISNDGKINTSSMGEDSIQATLTTTITKGSASGTKSFDVTIIKPVSQGKPVTASSSVIGHGPELINDGDPSTYLDSFRSSDGTAICQIDLLENYRLNGINIANYADGIRYYKYYVKISIDGINWIPVIAKNDGSLSTADGNYFDVKGNARYIRIYTTFNSVSEYEIHISEVRVFGEKLSGSEILPASIDNFETDKEAYKAGETAKASITVSNNSSSAVTINNIFDAVILATGNNGVNYLSAITKAPVLPVQFLVTSDTYTELRGVIDTANASGIHCYSTLGHDGSMKKGVAWVKLLDLPQAYKDFLVQHKVKNVIFAATENASGGESRAKKVIEPGTDINRTNAGDIFVMYPNGYTDIGLELDERELSFCLRDYKELNLEPNFRDFSDWESGMIQPQVDRLALTAKNTIGNNAKILQIAAGDAKALYDYASYSVAKFYDKNQANYNGNTIKGIVINPYLILHPAYEIYNGYLPLMLWQGNTNGSGIVNNLINIVGKGAVEKYFPDIKFDTNQATWDTDLTFRINYSNNFGGAFQAQEIKTALLAKGVPSSQIIENDYSKNEIWNPDDGMDAPVEKIAVDITQRDIKDDMKDKYSSLMPLSFDELIEVAADFSGIRTDILTDSSNGNTSNGGNGNTSDTSVSPVTVNGPVISSTPVLNNGVAISQVTSELLEKAFSAADENSKGQKTARITVQAVPGANEYVQQLPTSVLKAAEGTRSIQIETPVATVVLPSDALLTSTIQQEKVELSIAPADKSSLSTDLREQLGDKPVIEINFKVDGNAIAWNNPDAPVTILVNYKPTDEELKDPEHIVVWYVDNSGNVFSVPNGRYDAVTGKVIFTITHFSTYAVAYVNKSFADISQFPWAKKQIEVLASKGILVGTSEIEYSPVNSMTRADFLGLLMNTLELTQIGDSGFDDVKPGDHYYDAISTAKKLGITSGTCNNKFSPNVNISRQDMIVLAERALKLAKGYTERGIVADLSKFNDYSQIAQYAIQSIADFVKKGLIVGSGTSIYPTKDATRVEVAVLLYRLYNLESIK